MAGKHEGAMVRILLLRTRNEKNGRRETYNASLFTARDTTSNSCVATGLHYLARPVVGDTQDRSSGSFRQGAKGGCVRGSVSQPGLGAVPGLARPGDAVTSTGPPANSRMITVPSQAAGYARSCHRQQVPVLSCGLCNRTRSRTVEWHISPKPMWSP